MLSMWHPGWEPRIKRVFRRIERQKAEKAELETFTELPKFIEFDADVAGFYEAHLKLSSPGAGLLRDKARAREERAK